MRETYVTVCLNHAPRRMVMLSALCIGLVTAAICSAQEPTPLELRRDLARKKAERFERLQNAEISQTPNQSDYDVTYYSLDLAMDPVSSTISGYVAIQGTVTGSPLATVDIDLDDRMVVSQVTYTGGTLSFSHPGDLLTVTLDRTYAQGEPFSFSVYYAGTPQPSNEAFGFDTYNGQPMIWSLSEPFGARTWWPCKDVPSDKADSVDVRITVPDNLIVASNGTLVGEDDNGTTKTYHWHEGYPITTYLVSVAIYPYYVYSDWYHYSPTDSMEVRFYVFPDHYSYVQPYYAMTVDMIGVYAGLFGEYPFLNEKYGHAEFLWGAGMEHQTITSLGGWSEYMIVHELAHQWWGDMVTCNDFHHIWMNEGFATYSEALWSEARYGTARYHQDMADARYFGAGTIYVPDTSNWARIFHTGLSYNKGSWVLHMLRHVVGDGDFFQILRDYYADSRYQYGTITTEQFRDVCEEVSGMDLDWFFHEWIYEEYYPTYKYDWSCTSNGGLYDVQLAIDQLQTNFVFTMPVDVTVTTALGDTTLVVWDNLASQNFTLAVEGEPLAVKLDKDEWILRTVEEPIRFPTFNRGILVVNGVDFNSSSYSQIWSAYADSVFWGDFDISFWDCFEETGLGYPPNLPPPLGHGMVPADTLKQFSSVVWVGNNYNGDLGRWTDTSILSYLEAGGNVFLLTRLGQNFIDAALRDRIGITWRENTYNTLTNPVATHPSLITMSRTGPQDLCAVFDTLLTTPESRLLFKDIFAFPTPRGTGVLHEPASGGTHRPDGGKFVFVSGRPYRWEHTALRMNSETILGSFFGEPYVPTGVAENPPAHEFTLAQNHPNPFNPTTTIRFVLPEKALATIRVYEVAGHLVATVLSENLDAGPHKIAWNGKDSRGESVASGVYFYSLVAGEHKATRKMVLLR
jgi:aminopeptidase N